MKINNWNVYCQDLFIRERLSKIRKSKGITQKQLSEMTGLSTTTISNMESRNNSYTLRTLIKVIEALGYEINIDKKVGVDNDSEETNKGIPATDTR